MCLYRLYYNAGEDTVTKPEHVAIVDAIGRADANGAEQAMHVHLANAIGRLEAFFADRADDTSVQ